MEQKQLNELKELINRANEPEESEARLIEAHDVVIVIMVDYESNYYETAVIQDKEATFFGEPYGAKISLEQYLSNLRENWG